MKASKKEFLAEAEDLLFDAQQFVLQIQDTYQAGLNPDTVNGLFRSIHTLKGLSGLFGNQGITELSHALESILDDIRLGKVQISKEVIGFLFRNIDSLKLAVDAVKEDREEDLSGAVDGIETFRASLSRDEKGPDLKGLIEDSILGVLTEYEEHRLRTNIRNGNGIYILTAIFDLAVFDTELEEMTKKIKSSGELISTLPTPSGAPDGSIAFNLMFAADKDSGELGKILERDINILIPPRAPELPPRKTEQSIQSKTTTVRVDIDKLDVILNTISELTLAKDAVKRIGSEMSEYHEYSTFVRDIFKISQTLERRLSELQDEVLEIRMVPIGQIFSRLAQVIRRGSREMNKEIEVALYGEDTELDKSLAEEIVDPLMHLVRNSIDHGIETVEQRKKEGKKPEGIITLKAFQKGNYVVIEVSDDGAGIDVKRIREKALAMGLLEPVSDTEDHELINFIFTPGFSTKENVSEISGRGVGMDVVREKLLSLGGLIEVSTERGRGTAFALTLPITLAIIKALIVRAGKEKFAIPITTITETIAISPEELQTVEWKEVYYLRGEMLPIVRLGKVFDIEPEQNDISFAVVMGYGRRKLGLMVDEIIGQHEIVIKSLGEYLKGLPGLAGAAEIGKHEVVLVLDVESLTERSLARTEGASHG